jgi:hypothetical protein
MRQRDDFQFEERVEQNVIRKKSFLRWMAFAINLICFLLYVLFLIIDFSQVFYRGSPYEGLYHSMPHVLLIPLLLWFVTLIIQLGSVLMESRSFNKYLAQNAAHQEQQIIDSMLDRLAQAEKRKHASSRLNEEFEAPSQEFKALSHLEIEEHPRHALL